MRGRAALLAGLLTALAGCSGTVPYRYSGEDNVEVRSNVIGARARLHVHRLEAPCQTTYEGSVELSEPVVSLAIPPDRPTVLVVSFATSSFLGGSRGTVSRELTLKPRAGYRYRIDVRYRDAIYDVEAIEIARGTTRTRPLELGVDCTVIGK